MLHDDTYLMENVRQQHLACGSVVEVRSNLPGFIDVRTILSKIRLWKEVADTENVVLRIIAPCPNLDVEKAVQRILANYDNLFLGRTDDD